MPASAAVPGLFLCFAATVLLVFVRALILKCLLLIDIFHQASISSPTWDKISFLDVGTGRNEVHYGVFGYTNSKTAIGYNFQGLR